MTYYCKVVVGPGGQHCTLLEVWVLRVGMLTVDTTPFLYVEDRGLQVPMTLEHDKTSQDLTRELDSGFQIGVIRPIRVDHTDFFKWVLKLIHSTRARRLCTSFIAKW
jgi:hypothetical protein